MVSISLPLLFALTGLSLQDGDGATFAAPLRLMAGDEPMGHAQLYPSPALFDLDGDGVAEMIVGDLFGSLKVSRRTGDDRLAWSRAEPLEGADGEALDFDNW